MTRHLFSVFSSFALGLTLVLAVPAVGGTIAHEGWLYGEEADKAIELAQEHNVPVAVMRVQRTTDCPKCIGAARQMAASKSTKQMVRVMAYVGGGDNLKSEATNRLMNKAYGQTKDPSNWIPDLYFVMPDGRVLGFVPYEDSASTESEAKAVLQMAAWLKGVDKVLEKADRDAEKGRYEAALKDIDELMVQDAKINHMIRIQTGVIDKKEKMPETPVSLFFPNLKDEKVAAYQALAMEQIDKARKLIESKELREAQSLLRTLSRTPEGWDANTKAQAMMQEVVDLLKAS